MRSPYVANKINNFTDLLAWQAGQKLILKTYELIKAFPSEEKFCLANQMQRCAISITSNIAEGFGRNTAKDKRQFYGIARGSALELQSQLYAAKDLRYITQEEFFETDKLITHVAKLIAGLSKTAVDR